MQMSSHYWSWDMDDRNDAKNATELLNPEMKNIKSALAKLDANALN